MLYCGRRHGKFESPIHGTQAVVFGYKKSEQSEPCTMNKVAAFHTGAICFRFIVAGFNTFSATREQAPSSKFPRVLDLLRTMDWLMR
jgi:hypothetical protein